MIFIGGTGRSGTTLLTRVFQCEGRYATFYEPGFLVRHGGLIDYAYNGLEREAWRENLYGRFLPNMRRKVRQWNGEHLVKLFNDKTVQFVEAGLCRLGPGRRVYAREFTVRLLSLLHAPLGTSEIVHKTPHSIVVADKLLDLFPESWFIHIIRDPLDVCASVIGKRWGPNKPETFIPWYNDLMERAWSAMEPWPSGRYAVVEMETLARYPLATLEVTLDRLGIAPFGVDARRCAEGLVNEGRAHVGRWRASLEPVEAGRVRLLTESWYNTWKAEAQ